MKIRLGAFIVAAIALGVVSSDSRAQDGDYRRTCIAPLSNGDPFANAPESRQLDIAQRCWDIARATNTGGVRAARARFYAGRAYRILGAQPGGRAYLTEAIRHLEAAVSVGPDFPVAEFGAEQRAATIELVQAYRLNGDNRAARERLDRTGSGALPQDDGAVAYQRAMLILAERGAETQAGKEGAFDALRPIFTRPTDLLRPPPPTGANRRNVVREQGALSDSEIRAGRALLFALGSELGQTALTAQRNARDRAQVVIEGNRAVEFLSAAKSVVRESNWSVGATEGGRAPSIDEMAGVYFDLGQARLAAAGVARRPNGPDLDCVVAERQRGADFAGHIRDAREDFGAIIANESVSAGRRQDAHWGLGCATLANLDPPRNVDSELQSAVRDLRLAVGQTAEGAPQAGAVPRPNYLLTLARALFLQDAGDAARRAYEDALRALSASASADTYAGLRSEIYVDIARTHLFVRCRGSEERARGGCISFRNPNPYDLSNVGAPNDAARRALEEALRADSGNSDARLMLAQVHQKARNWGAARTELNLLLGRTRLGRGERNLALAEDDPRKAFARYLSSRGETFVRQACLAENDAPAACSRRGDADLAFNDAARASMSDQANPEYRLQACIAIILFGRAQDERYCIANSPDAQALLLEGMYWLRRSHGAGQGTVQDRWGQSLGAFERGSALASGNATIYPEGFPPQTSIPLSDLLRYGERYVRLCAIGRAGDTESSTQQVKDYFHQSGMLPCLVRN